MGRIVVLLLVLLFSLWLVAMIWLGVLALHWVSVSQDWDPVSSAGCWETHGSLLDIPRRWDPVSRTGDPTSWGLMPIGGARA
jgi:hypothetical protein